ncbi:DUF4232 domain-containing protein [Nocardia sp. NPDC088792]|uniref:DUF4232 domain-containing protein n=1 Tax=Nocardia sp. NPDC088792 TaxID=3364332 RepID=UPI00382EB393
MQLTGCAPDHAAPSGPSAQTSSAGPPSALWCVSADLRMSLRGGGAAMGTETLAIDFTNIGATACRLSGTPRVVLATGSPDHHLDSTTADSGSRSASDPVVTLAPGGQTTALARYRVAYFNNGCDKAIADYFVVYPPESTTPTALPGSGADNAAYYCRNPDRVYWDGVGAVGDR